MAEPTSVPKGETGEGPKPQPLSVEPGFGLAADAWTRFRARFLDPATAVQFPGEPVRPTVYVADTLLVRRNPSAPLDQTNLLDEVATRAGFDVVQEHSLDGERRGLVEAGLPGERADELLSTWPVRVQLVRRSIADRVAPPSAPADAWQVLQAYRLAARTSADEHDFVGLEHLVTAAAPGIGGTPYTSSHGIGGTPYTSSHGIGGTPYTSSHGVTGYGVPGLGGRQPVNWLGPVPRGQHGVDPNGPVRRPVVAVLDTGVAEHPWLDDGHVIRDPKVGNEPMSISAGVPDSEIGGVSDPLVGGLDPDAGHGTFIAGLIRQACPDATVLAVRVFRGDGVVAEGDLLHALKLTAARHLLALSGRKEYQAIDIVSLSLGYYHEQPADSDFDRLLAEPLRLLARYGVAVVTAAGNDATVRPMYPAAMATYAADGTPPPADNAPLVSVGALNPDSSVALFSNAGPWVRFHRPGASLVSTHPRTFDASMSPTAEFKAYDGSRRASIDPDDFSSGFAVWSGTSFAAPVFAGELAARLLDRFVEGDDSTDPRAASARAQKLVTDMKPVWSVDETEPKPGE